LFSDFYENTLKKLLNVWQQNQIIMSFIIKSRVTCFCVCRQLTAHHYFLTLLLTSHLLVTSCKRSWPNHFATWYSSVQVKVRTWQSAASV